MARVILEKGLWFNSTKKVIKTLFYNEICPCVSVVRKLWTKLIHRIDPRKPSPATGWTSWRACPCRGSTRWRPKRSATSRSASTRDRCYKLSRLKFRERMCDKGWGPFLTSPPGANFDPQGRSCPPGVNFVPWGWSYLLGVNFSVCPSILLNSRECSPRGVYEGLNIPPRG
jgi:hypothetical protein